jgi:membrane-associated protease RseP (regulator of RpoE activity)
VDSQLAWDRAMAEVLASQTRPTASGAKPLIVGIMGSGHLRFGHGVPHQLRDLGVRSIGTLLPMAASSPCDELGPGLADAVFAVPTPPLVPVEPPRLGVALESKDGRIRIASVSKGSLAEKSGLQDGDQILAVAGQPLPGLTSLLNVDTTAAAGNLVTAADRARRREDRNRRQVPGQAMSRWQALRSLLLPLLLALATPAAWAVARHRQPRISRSNSLSIRPLASSPWSPR